MPAYREAPAPAAPPSPLRPRRAASGFYLRGGKRALSLALTFASLPVALPLTAALAACNWIQLGELRRVFFCQTRCGRGRRPFVIYKFRTLRECADEPGGLAPTPFGAWLRRHHLDELPQLWNIVRGDMCLVGPRPEMEEIERWAEGEVPGFASRLEFRPGLTGLAQVTQGPTAMDAAAYREKLRLHDEYAARAGLWTDLRILFASAWVALRGRSCAHVKVLLASVTPREA